MDDHVPFGFGRLNANINDTVTAITMQAGHTLIAPTNGYAVVFFDDSLNHVGEYTKLEVGRVIGKPGTNDFTITRGVEETANSHDAGTMVFAALTDKWYDDLKSQLCADLFATELTLDSGGEITLPSVATSLVGTVLVDTYSAASTDDLDTINGGRDGQWLLLRQKVNARDVRIRDGVGNIYARGNVQFTNVGDFVLLKKVSTDWYVISESLTARARDTAFAWAFFDGVGAGIGDIKDSHNVSSITDLGGAGAFEVNFTWAAPDTDYAAVATVSSSSALVARIEGKTTAKVTVKIFASDTTTLTDADCSVACFSSVG